MAKLEVNRDKDVFDMVFVAEGRVGLSTESGFIERTSYHPLRKMSENKQPNSLDQS